MKHLIFLFGITLLFACKKDKAALSSAKEVTSFEVKFTDGVVVTVGVRPDKTIRIDARCPTNENAITVTPTISPKATCSLAAGTVLDLRKTQKFTVTAEDGTTQTYTVFVKGVSMYSSEYYRSCTKHDVSCTVQFQTFDARVNSCQQIGSDVYFDFYFQSLENPNVYPYFTQFSVQNKTLSSDLINAYTITTQAYFNSQDGGLPVGESGGAPQGTFTVTYMDTENKLISGTFDFTQNSNGNCNHRDHLIGQFYSIPY
jgi:hypothetical protein